MKVGQNGAPLSRIVRNLKSLVPRQLNCKALNTEAQIRDVLDRGGIVATGDDVTWIHSHAILIVGYTPCGYWVMDPWVGIVTWRSAERVLRSAGENFEFHGLWRKNTSVRTQVVTSTSK